FPTRRSSDLVGTASNEIVDNTLQIELNRGQQGVDYTQATVADQSKITVKDAEGITRTIANAAVENEILTIEVADSDLLELAPFTVDFEEGALEVETDKVLVPSLEYEEGDYTNSLYNDKFSTIVNAPVDSGYKSVEAVKSVTADAEVDAEKGYNVNTITVQYSEEMGASATNISNYSFDGEALPEGSKATMDTTNNVVTITLPNETFAEDYQQKLVISDDVLTAKGEHVVGNIATNEEYHSELLTFED